MTAAILGVDEEMQIDIPDGVTIHVYRRNSFEIKTFKAIGGTYTVSGTHPVLENGEYTLWYIKRFPDERTKMVNGETVTYDTWFVDVQDIPTPPRQCHLWSPLC